MGKTIYGSSVAAIIENAYKEQIDPDAWGTWAVHGEDPNCDMGGPHSNPYLGSFSGTLREAALWATKQGGYYQWGSGGYLQLSSAASSSAVTNDPVRAAAERVNAATKDLERAQKEHDEALRNSEVRLSVLKKVEPFVKILSKDERAVVLDVLGALLKMKTA